jgi:hypothetical protein
VKKIFQVLIGLAGLVGIIRACIYIWDEWQAIINLISFLVNKTVEVDIPLWSLPIIFIIFVLLFAVLGFSIYFLSTKKPLPPYFPKLQAGANLICYILLFVVIGFAGKPPKTTDVWVADFAITLNKSLHITVADVKSRLMKELGKRVREEGFHCRIRSYSSTFETGQQVLSRFGASPRTLVIYGQTEVMSMDSIYIYPEIIILDPEVTGTSAKRIEDIDVFPLPISEIDLEMLPVSIAHGMSMPKQLVDNPQQIVGYIESYYYIKKGEMEKAIESLVSAIEPREVNKQNRAIICVQAGNVVYSRAGSPQPGPPLASEKS